MGAIVRRTFVVRELGQDEKNGLVGLDQLGL